MGWFIQRDSSLRSVLHKRILQVKTEADKTRFIVEFEQREGIRLDPEKVEKNSGFRAIAKLILNSFWVGYFT